MNWLQRCGLAHSMAAVGWAACVVSALSGCGERATEGKPILAGADVAVAVADAAGMPVSGEALYGEHCAGCHMADGGGVPDFQPSLVGSPILSAPPVRLEIVIRAGSAALTDRQNPFGTEMPPFAYLTDVEVKAIMAFVRGRFQATTSGDS